MAEYVAAGAQEVQPGQNVLLDASIPCTRGYVLHRAGSGILTLRGATSGCSRFARYQAVFNANIAVPEGGTAQAIAVALAIGGEALQTSKAIVTPAAAGDYFNVTSTAIIDVPSGCCAQLAVENASDGVGTAAAPAIEVANANLTISRIA